MKSKLLDALERLDQAASKAPWRIDQLDDDMCMGLVAVTTGPAPTTALGGRNWSGDHVVAACLVQSPPYVMPLDDRWEENAALISEMRNALPELVRLARIGLAYEQGRMTDPDGSDSGQ